MSVKEKEYEREKEKKEKEKIPKGRFFYKLVHMWEKEDRKDDK